LREFSPHLEILPASQRRLWNELSAVPKEFVTLSVVVERAGRVRASFFGVPRLQRLEQPLISKDNKLKVASLLDLAGTKASVLQVRAEAKDYIDMDALMRVGDISLPKALAAGRELYGTSFNPEVTLKALSYFGDGNLNTLPEEVRDRLAAAARNVDLERLPEVRPMDHDHGL
jgi:hypothetical protein